LHGIFFEKSVNIYKTNNYAFFLLFDNILLFLFSKFIDMNNDTENEIEIEEGNENVKNEVPFNPMI